jgi:CBS domain-containing protein
LADTAALARIRTGQIMVGPPPVVPPTITNADATSTMVYLDVDATVVVDRAGRPLGVVTSTDVVTRLAAQQPVTATP